jgi:hypothetical protein
MFYHGDDPSSASSDQETTLHRVRERQWMYLRPIAAAPLAHIGVTLYRSSKTPVQKQVVVAGVVGSTVLAVGMRLASGIYSWPMLESSVLEGYGGPSRRIQDSFLLAITTRAYRITLPVLLATLYEETE